MLKVARRRDLAFSQDDVEFLEHIADRAAVILQQKSGKETKGAEVNNSAASQSAPQQHAHQSVPAPAAAAEAIPFSLAPTLINSEALLATYFRASKVGFAVVDTEFRYLGVNERLAAMHGIPASTHLGKTLHEILGDVSQIVHPYVENVLSTGQPISDVELA